MLSISDKVRRVSRKFLFQIKILIREVFNRVSRESAQKEIIKKGREIEGNGFSLLNKI